MAVNLDIDYINYKNAHFRTTTDPSYPPYAFTIENKIAKEVFKRAINARIGAEYNLSIPVTLRAGFGFNGRAYNKEYEVDQKTDKLFTLGAGYKIGANSFDFTFRFDQQNRNYYTYLPTGIPLRERNYSFLFSYRVII